MKIVETVATVATNGKMVLQVPPEIASGRHKVIVVVEDPPMEKVQKRSLEITTLHLEN